MNSNKHKRWWDCSASVTLDTTGAFHARCVAAARAKYRLNIEVHGAEIRVYERNEFIDVPRGNLSKNSDENHNRF
jgi:hypothetical protein